jgi:hypothetical protein
VLTQKHGKIIANWAGYDPISVLKMQQAELKLLLDSSTS